MLSKEDASIACGGTLNAGDTNLKFVMSETPGNCEFPPSGEVTIRETWSTGERTRISISPDCMYTVTGHAAESVQDDQPDTCKCEESYNNGKKQRNRCIPPVPPWNPICFSKGYTIFTDVLIDGTNCTCDMESHQTDILSGTPSTTGPSVTINNYITVLVAHHSGQGPIPDVGTHDRPPVQNRNCRETETVQSMYRPFLFLSLLHIFST